MTASASGFYVLGGTLPRDSRSYVARQADDDLLDGLRRGQFCYVLTSRQMGKSSLMVRTATRLRQERITCIVLDLTSVGQNLTDEQWYDGLLNSVAAQTDLEDELDAFWLKHKRLGPLQRWMHALKSVVLARISGRIVLFIDEIDAVRSLPFSADELFAAIRECHNRRAEDPDFQRITFCLLGVATPADLIRDTRSTPFNIGRRIELTDFTAAEAEALEEGLTPQVTLMDAEGKRTSRKDAKTQREKTGGYGAGWRAGASARGGEPHAGVRNPRLLARILYWTGGHPYLTQRLCQAVSEAMDRTGGSSARQSQESSRSAGKFEIFRSITPSIALVDAVCAELFLSPGARNQDDNLLFVRERLLRSEADRAGLLEIYDRICAGQRVKDDETSPLLGVLRLAGVVRTEGAYLRVRNRIYSRVFDRDWIRANMPDAEMRRQKMAYRRGFARAAALSALVVLVTGMLAVIALHETEQARRNARLAMAEKMRASEQAQAAERNLYAADIGLAQQAWNDRDFRRVGELLRETHPAGQQHARGFEWGLLHRRGHFDLPFLPDTSGYVTSEITFSSDGRYVRTNNGHGTVTYWNASASRIVPGLHNVPQVRVFTNLSPDGAVAAEGRHYASEEPEYKHSRVTLRDRRTGRALHQLLGAIAPTAFSPDGRLLATEIPNGVAVWNTATGERMQAFPGCMAPFAFSPDGKRLAVESFSYGWGVKLFDVATPREPVTVNNTADAAALSPDGSLLATLDADWKGVTVRNAITLKPLTKLHGATYPITCLSDGRTVATGSRQADATAILWDTASGAEKGRIKTSNGFLGEMAAQPGGSLLAINGQNGGVELWDAKTGKQVRTYPGASGKLAFSPDGKLLALWDTNAGVIVTEAGSGRRLYTLADASGPMAFSPAGPMIATGGPNNSVVLWDARTGATIRSFKAQRFPLHACTFSPDGQRLAAGDSGEYNVVIWDTATGRETFHIPGKTDRTDVSSYALFFSPDGLRLYSGNRDGTLTVWEADAIR